MLHAISALPHRSNHQPAHGNHGGDLQPLLKSKDPSKANSLFEELSTLDSCSDSKSDTSMSSDTTKPIGQGDATVGKAKERKPILFKKKLRWYRSLDEHSVLVDDYDAFLLRNVSDKDNFSKKMDCDESVSMAAMSDWTGGSALHGKGNGTSMCLSNDDDALSMFDEMSAIYSYNAESLVSKDTYHLGSDANANDESFDLSTLATMPPSDEESNMVDARGHHSSIGGGEKEASRNSIPPKYKTSHNIIILGVTDDTSTIVFPSSDVIHHAAAIRKRGHILRTTLNCLRRLITDPLLPRHTWWYHQSKKWEI